MSASLGLLFASISSAIAHTGFYGNCSDHAHSHLRDRAPGTSVPGLDMAAFWAFDVRFCSPSMLGFLSLRNGSIHRYRLFDRASRCTSRDSYLSPPSGVWRLSGAEVGNESSDCSIALLSQRTGGHGIFVCTYSGTIRCALAHTPPLGMCPFSRILY